MIRLGLRLTLGGGREAAVRLVVTAAAVAVGVGLLLIALAGMNAIPAQNARTAWLNTAGFGRGPQIALPTVPGAPASDGRGPTGAATTATDPLWWFFSTDSFGDQTIDRVDVAGTGVHSPIPPGLTRLPGAGQFYASPALTRLLRSTPGNELGDRYPGRQIGTIGPAALPSPDSLIIVVGDTSAHLSNEAGASEVGAINTSTGHSGGSVGWDANKLQVILAVGALSLLFPVLILIGTATRLSAARREQRFAAIRLVGATPRQVVVLAAVEASVAAFAGVVIGFGVFFVLRPVLTRVPFTGVPFAPGDLSLTAVDVLLVAVGVPIAAAAVAQLAMRRVQISPLGVSRRTAPPTPRAYRLLPLLAGLGELLYFVVVGAPAGTGGQILAYFSGCLLVMIGLVVAGPWLTMLGSRWLAHRANRAASLIAARRLADDPRGAFRAISGLVVAIFVTSVSVGVITTILDNSSASSGTAASSTLVDQFPGPPPPGQRVPEVSVPAALLSALRAMQGVVGVTVLHTTTAGANQREPVLATCDQLARTPAIGRCAPGIAVVTVTGSLDNNAVTNNSTLATTTWPAANVSVQGLDRLPVWGIALQTSGSIPVIERARTVLDTALPDAGPASTLGEISSSSTRTISELQQLTKVVIIVSLVIAGCGLAVSVTGGVNDRKRPFSLLRLTGVPLRVLREVVALEAAVPLLVIAVLSAALGFVAAGLFLNSQLGETLRPPGAAYYILVTGGLVASLAVIASALPLIARITGPDIARIE